MIRRPLARLGGDDRGTALVEFAFIAPLLILFYIGMAELCQGLMAERKAAHAASAVADIVAQSEETTPAGIAEVINMAPEVLKPFDSGVNPDSGQERLKIRVSSVRVDPADDKPKVRWSESRNWSDYGDDTVIDLPEVPDGAGSKDFIAEGESVIMTEVEYGFNTPFSDIFVEVQKLVVGTASMTGNYTFKSVYYLRPRRSDEVVCTAC